MGGGKGGGQVGEGGGGWVEDRGGWGWGKRTRGVRIPSWGFLLGAF